ncbi:MAG TPA: PilZ domain-containing protein [Verrucomicrobiae bacterium]|nr:PilZ domain-containing protein [Verrucomicrobiae bacterium]
MSARKVGSIGSFQPVTLEARQTRLELSTDSVAIHKSGIEFRSPTAFSPWTEMTVTLALPHEGKVHCTGVVVNCSGNKHLGYRVSMLFTSLTKQAQAQLNVLARSAVGAG